MSDIGDTGEGHTPEGLEGYPYASPQAEQKIKLVTTVVSVIAMGLLLVGLYLALFTTEVLLGTIFAVVGFVDLIIVPFLAKRMRRAALTREGPS